MLWWCRNKNGVRTIAFTDLKEGDDSLNTLAKHSYFFRFVFTNQTSSPSSLSYSLTGLFHFSIPSVTSFITQFHTSLAVTEDHFSILDVLCRRIKWLTLMIRETTLLTLFLSFLLRSFLSFDHILIRMMCSRLLLVFSCCLAHAV
jgi:hypothetical protein